MAPVLQKVTYAKSSVDTNPNITINLGSVTTDRTFFAFYGNYQSAFQTSHYASAITVNGQPMVEEIDARATRGVGFLENYKIQCFRIKNEVSTGNTVFSVTITDAAESYLIVAEVTGADELTPVGAVDSHNAGSSNLTFSLTSTADDSLLLCAALGRNDPGAPATGITEDIDADDGSTAIWSGHRFADIGTHTVGCTLSGSFGVGGVACALEVLAVVDTSLNASSDTTDADDTGTGAGTVEIDAAGATTDQDDVNMSAGAVEIVGSAATVDADDLSSATAAHTFFASSATTDQDDTGSGAAEVEVIGSSAVVEDDDSAAGVAMVPIDGAAATIDADDIGTGAGSVDVVGASDTTDDDDQALATALTVLEGTSATTDQDDASTAVATLEIVGSLATIDEDDITAGVASSGDLTASSATVDQDDTGSGAAAVELVGSSSVTDADDFALGVAQIVNLASAAIVDQDDVAAGTGVVALVGSSAVTDDDDTGTGMAMAPIVGASATIDQDDVGSGAAAVEVVGSSSVTDADDIGTGLAQIVNLASAAIVDQDDVGSGAAIVELVGSSAIVEDDDVSAGAAGVEIVGAGAAIDVDDVLDAFAEEPLPTIFGAANTNDADDFGQGVAIRPPSKSAICDGIAEIVRAALPAVTVTCDRTRAIPADELPAIDIRPGDETTTRADRYTDFAALAIELVVVVAGDDGDDAVDDLAAVVEQALYASPIMAAYAFDFGLDETEIEFNDEGETPFVAATLSWSLRYSVARAIA